jgi:hypothetical protein
VCAEFEKDVGRAMAGLRSRCVLAAALLLALVAVCAAERMPRGGDELENMLNQWESKQTHRLLRHAALRRARRAPQPAAQAPSGAQRTQRARHRLA